MYLNKIYFNFMSRARQIITKFYNYSNEINMSPAIVKKIQKWP